MSLAALAEKIKSLEGKSTDPRVDELVAFMNRAKPMLEDWEKLSVSLKAEEPPVAEEAPTQG